MSRSQVPPPPPAGPIPRRHFLLPTKQLYKSSLGPYIFHQSMFLQKFNTEKPACQKVVSTLFSSLDKSFDILYIQSFISLAKEVLGGCGKHLVKEDSLDWI